MPQTSQNSSTDKWLWVLIPALFVQLVGAGLYFLWKPEWSFFLYPATKVLMLSLPIGVFFLKWRLPSIRVSSKKAGWVTAIVASLIYVSLATLLWNLLPGLFSPYEEAVRETVLRIGIQEFFILFAVFLSLAHSLFEEYYWRSFVFRGLLLKTTFLPAALISSIAFSSHHVIVLAQFTPLWMAIGISILIAGMGIFWCWLYQRSGSLLPVWLNHAIVDMTVMTIGYLMIT